MWQLRTKTVLLIAVALGALGCQGPPHTEVAIRNHTREHLEGVSVHCLNAHVAGSLWTSESKSVSLRPGQVALLRFHPRAMSNLAVSFTVGTKMYSYRSGEAFPPEGCKVVVTIGEALRVTCRVVPAA